MESEHPAQSSGAWPAGATPEPAAGTADDQHARVAWQCPETPGPVPTQQWPQPAPAAGWGATGWHPTESAVPTWHPADPTAPHGVTATPTPPGRRPGRLARMLTAGVAGAVLVAGAGVAGGLTVHAVDSHNSAATGISAMATKTSSGGTVTATSVVAAVEPSVVTIAAQSQGGTAEGSGVVVRSDGMIVTNYHVISGASGQITVTFHDGTSGTAQVVATNPTNDLALLQVQGASGLTAITLADSSAVQVGDDVIAIGNPLGLGISASQGIVSALDRPVTVSADQAQGRGSQAVSYRAIQTDAAVNEGNSGGALVNASGQLVGITSAIATSGSSTGNLGVAFAIPANQVHAFLTKALT